MKFTKMHGIGNDYVFVDCFSEQIQQPEQVARMASDRHFGIGSDGLILIKPSKCADFEMEMYNADGSKGKMCGNGIRCVAKYVYEKGLTRKKSITVETLAGIRKLELLVEQNSVTAVKVDMGEPVWESEQSMLLAGETRKLSCWSMGNPHCVIFVEKPVDLLDIEEMGRKLQQQEYFPQGVNVEFVNVLSKDCLRMRVWERGTGETLACGTGACAAMAAANKKGYIQDKTRIQLPGGELTIFWDKNSNHIFMTGAAVTVYEGDFILPEGMK